VGAPVFLMSEANLAKLGATDASFSSSEAS